MAETALSVAKSRELAGFVGQIPQFSPHFRILTCLASRRMLNHTPSAGTRLATEPPSDQSPKHRKAKQKQCAGFMRVWADATTAKG